MGFTPAFRHASTNRAVPYSPSRSVRAIAGMPSPAARRARSSGENAPSFKEKKDRASRCTNPGRVPNRFARRSVPEALHVPPVGRPVVVQVPHRPAPGLHPPVLAVTAVGPPPALDPPPADHVGHVVPLGHGRSASILRLASRTYVREGRLYPRARTTVKPRHFRVERMGVRGGGRRSVSFPARGGWMAEAEPDEPLVAVVPNFSEGRRRDVIDAICAALEVPGAHLVYRQADPDHNRLDTTVLGTPDAVRRSALAGTAKAVQLIDMEQHTGSHPRMGAADVIPFVPLRGITMDQTVELARDVARELADTLDLPVYLYDRAALVPERRSLAEVRKGEYEALKEAVARGERLPDFGPHAIGRAGATAVGARKPLIAFNIYLSSTDEEAAKEIARAVRESSGGLPAVRAIGFLVPERGCVTVSMNLVDHEVTGLRPAFEAVTVEAEKRGMTTLSSEIVGLAPQAAITDQDVIDLRLEGFDGDHQILERLVSRARQGGRS